MSCKRVPTRALFSKQKLQKCSDELKMIQFNLSGAEYQNNFQFKCFLSSNKLKIELLDYNRMKGSTDHFLNSDFGRNSVVFVSTQKKKKKNPLELKSPSLTSCSFQATKSLSEGGCLKQAVA